MNSHASSPSTVLPGCRSRDDEDRSLATPETDYRWDTSDGDLEQHSRSALDEVKRARGQLLSIVRSLSLSLVCGGGDGGERGANDSRFRPRPSTPRRTSNLLSRTLTSIHLRERTNERAKYRARVYFAKQRTRKRCYAMNGAPSLFSLLSLLFP